MITDADLVELWLNGKSEETIEAYKRDVRELLTIRPLAEWTKTQLLEYCGLINGSPATRYRKVAAIKSLFSFACKIDLLPSNPGKILKPPKVTDALAEQLLSESQVRQVWDQAVCSRDRLIMKLLYYTGMRVSELCGLKWEQINYRDGKVQLSVHGKGDKRRELLIPVEFYIAMVKGLKTESAKVVNLEPRMVEYIVKQAGERAGIKIHPHLFRHCYATHSKARGVDQRLLQVSLGHSSIVTTGRYWHVDIEDSAGMSLDYQS